jgi:hypothetical protein
MPGPAREPRHTACLPGGRLLDVLALIERVRDNPPRLLTLAELGAASLSRRKATGFEAARYVLADPSFPVIVDEAGRLLDGRHRLCKLHDLGAESAWAVVASEADIALCLVRPPVDACCGLCRTP